MARKKRVTPGLNGAGTSDISFLLLCFFLMTSSMDQSKGLARRLPPIVDNPQDVKDQQVKGHNVFQVLVDGQDRLSVNMRIMDFNDLRAEVKDFLQNPTNNPNKSSKKTTNIPGAGNVDISEGVISLQNVRSTSYEAYMRVQNELVAAYNDIRNEESRNRFQGKSFAELTENQQEIVSKIWPQRISEAPPKDTRKKK